jgi:hypothetical protein
MKSHGYDEPESVILPLMGRAGVFQGRKTFQLFAQLQDDNGVFVPPDQGTIISGVGWNAPYLPQSPGACGDGLEPRKHKCERVWRISTAAETVYRISQADVPPLTPSEFAEFELPGATLPVGVGAIMGGNGWYRIWVKANDNTGNRRFFMDLDETVEIYAFDVQVMLVGPPQTILITGSNGPGDVQVPVTLNGTVIDVRVGASIMPIEQTTGLNSTRFTQLIPVPLNTTVDIPVPRFARAVKIYANTAGAGPGPWQRQAGATGSTFNVGQINFTARTSNDSDAELGRESHLRTDLDALFDRQFIVQWTIVP